MADGYSSSTRMADNSQANTRRIADTEKFDSDGTMMAIMDP